MHGPGFMAVLTLMGGLASRFLMLSANTLFGLWSYFVVSFFLLSMSVVFYYFLLSPKGYEKFVAKLEKMYADSLKETERIGRRLN